MGLHGEHDNFDFDACLALARGLWRLADQAATTSGTRVGAGRVVMSTWKGVYATQTSTSLDNSATTAIHAESGLREEANLLAGRWADEFLKEANARCQDAANDADSHKSWVDKVGDFFGGDSTYSDHPRPTRPQPPNGPAFTPTATLPTYDFR